MAIPQPPLLVTRLVLASILGVNVRTIDKFMDDGMPVAVRGKGGQASQYDVRDCVQWYVARERAALMGDGEGLSPHKERALLNRKQVEEIELRLKTKRGELVPADEASRDFAECAANVKARMRRVPSSVADRIVAAASQGPHAVTAILRAEIDVALRELSTSADADAGAA